MMDKEVAAQGRLRAFSAYLRVIQALLLGTVVFLLAACGTPQATPTPTAVAPGVDPTATPVATDPFEAEWQELIRAAQGEGEIVMLTGGAADNLRLPLLEFGRIFNINVVISSGRGREHVDRLSAERAAGRYTADVFFGGGTSVNERILPLMETGIPFVDPVQDYLIHPLVTDQSLWYQGRHWYIDSPQRYGFVFSADASEWPVTVYYNRNLVDPNQIESTWDLLDDRWKGMIGSAPATQDEGQGGTFLTMYVHPDLGQEYIRRFLTEMDVHFSSDSRLLSDGLARGRFAFLMAVGGAIGNDVAEMRDNFGLPVDEMTHPIREQGILGGSGSSNLFSILNNPANPAATRLWVNWWLSPEGQTIMHTHAESPPDPTLREDVNEWGKVREVDRRIPGERYLIIDQDPDMRAAGAGALDYAYGLYRDHVLQR